MHPIGTIERKARREGAAAPPPTNRTRRDADPPAAVGHRPVTAADVVRGDALAALRSLSHARYLTRQAAFRRGAATRVFATD